MEPLTFDSNDVGLVEATVSRLYSRMRIGAVGERTRAHITRRVMAPEISFDDLDYSFDIGYSAEPQGLMIICDVVSNTIRREGEGGDEVFGPGDQFLISRPDLPYAGVAHATRLQFTLIDPALLTRVAATGKADEADPVRVLDHRPVSREAALQLRRSIAYVRDSVLDAPDAAQAPLVVSTASQYLAARVLQTFPTTAVSTPSTADRHDASPSTVRRAVAFIDANPDLELTLTDIARAACVTPRGLQLAFRRHLDTTPMSYLRRVRLDHARDELCAATADDGRTVATVAARWGFTHSRFTQQYRSAYGELPSRTLRDGMITTSRSSA
ncbi:helix-turn-helix transcriptional regulator [Pseudonocardia halophobica]|uniref:helix-turn-helix transcriptional regulator n=1 Tax=Pseudonocardia halophobica TaxID=29401 RepID=UPI003D91A941